MVKNELTVQRMSFWFIQSRAMSSVTPQDIRQAYRLYLEQNPAYSVWKYRVVSVRVDHADDMFSQKVYQFLTEHGSSPESLEEELKQFEAPGVAIAVSTEYTAKTQDLSDIHKTALSALEPGTFSKPAFQTSRVDKKSVYRIFYLVHKEEHPAPGFEDLAAQLRNDLTQKAVAQESQVYLGKLRKHYGFEPDKTLPEDLHPFSLQ